jgi:16S rRNA (adenine1518-N6/adenine1519-N6)-dimethyltransferase
MFTGLVQALGTVSRVEADGHGGRRLAVVEPQVGPHLTVGESVAVNGACLTVVRRDGAEFHFEAGPETLAKTNLGGLGDGDRVNLERALRVGDALGGHFVTGHVDVLGAVVSRERTGEWETVWFGFPPGWDELLVPKGVGRRGRGQPHRGGRGTRAAERHADPAHPGRDDARVQAGRGGGEPGVRLAGEARAEVGAGAVTSRRAGRVSEARRPGVGIHPKTAGLGDSTRPTKTCMAIDKEIPILPEHPAEPDAPPPPREPDALPDGKHPSPRQTLSYLRSLFQANGLEAKSKLGQNYLIDLNLIDLIARTAELSPDDAVLEVGTGTGSLTAQLAKAAGAVVTVEIDKTFHPIARHVVGDRQNVTYLLGDCLAGKSELNPDMLAAWDAAAAGGRRRKLVANLPYVIATPLLANLLVSDIIIERMVVMVQWEMAERMMAAASTKDYNALSVLVQALADIQVVRKVLPGNFYPRPKVDSAIVMIRPDPAKRAAVGDVKRFQRFLRDLYIHRRKNLRQALAGAPGGRRAKADVDAKLAELGIEGSVRAESLDVGQHLRLSEAFGE